MQWGAAERAVAHTGLARAAKRFEGAVQALRLVAGATALQELCSLVPLVSEAWREAEARVRAERTREARAAQAAALARRRDGRLQASIALHDSLAAAPSMSSSAAAAMLEQMRVQAETALSQSRLSTLPPTARHRSTAPRTLL